jgi:hypothetical protein
MRDKQFYLNAVKMDLLRLVYYVGNLENPISEKSIAEFVKHALTDLDRLELNSLETNLKQELRLLAQEFTNYLYDPKKRLRWAEKVLTIRCQL